MSIRKAKQEQEEISQIVMLWDLFKPMETKIMEKTKNKMQGKKIFAARKSVLNDADNISTEKEKKIVKAYRNEKIMPGILKDDIFIRDLEPEPLFEESISERIKMIRQKKI